MSETLHPDFPATPEKGTSTWDMPSPLNDIEAALAAAGGRADIWDIAEVTDWSISHHGIDWTKGGSGGSELSMFLIARLKPGRVAEWVALEAWNDFTGWGCQDGADAYYGPTREDVIANGLTNDGRSALGMETR